LVEIDKSSHINHLDNGIEGGEVMKFQITVILLSVLPLSMVWAQKQHPIDVALQSCLSENFTTSGMMQCSKKGMAAWNNELNTKYQKLARVLSDEAVKHLRQSQRQWLKFRDSEIQLLHSMYQTKQFQGTMFRSIQAQDVMDLTKQRALELTDRLDMHSLP